MEFIIKMEFELNNGEKVLFEGAGSQEVRIDYFDGWPSVSVSPKQLAKAKNVNDLIKLLEKGVVDNTWDDEIYIFKKSRPVKSDAFEGTFDAYDFIKLIKEHIKDIKDIAKIEIEMREYNDMHFFRKYTYTCASDTYNGIEMGTPEAAEEYIGEYLDQSVLSFSDINECTIIHKEDLYKDADPDDIYSARGCIAE